MIVKKHRRGMLVLLPALLCLPGLAGAGTPEATEATNAPDTGKAASGSMKAKPKAGAPKPSSAAHAQPEAGASGAASNPDNGEPHPVTRGLVPDSPHPGVEPTNPWPRSDSATQTK